MYDRLTVMRQGQLTETERQLELIASELGKLRERANEQERDVTQLVQRAEAKVNEVECEQAKNRDLVDQYEKVVEKHRAQVSGDTMVVVDKIRQGIHKRLMEMSEAITTVEGALQRVKLRRNSKIRDWRIAEDQYIMKMVEYDQELLMIRAKTQEVRQRIATRMKYRGQGEVKTSLSDRCESVDARCDAKRVHIERIRVEYEELENECRVLQQLRDEITENKQA